MRAIAAIVVIMGLTCCFQVKAENGKHIVLPDFKLAGASVPNLSRLWQDQQPTDAAAVYPKQVSINMDNGVVQGRTAVYDKSVSINEIQAAINKRYGKFAMARFEMPPLMLWRIELEKFAISLSEADDEMKQLIYLKFDAKSVRPGWKCKFAN